MLGVLADPPGGEVLISSYIMLDIDESAHHARMVVETLQSRSKASRYYQLSRGSLKRMWSIS